MPSYVMIECFKYKELDVRGQGKVLNWLDECPMDYTVEDDDGNNITTYAYPSEWTTEEVQEHCEMNEYLFDRSGRAIHDLILTEFKLPEP